MDSIDLNRGLVKLVLVIAIALPSAALAQATQGTAQASASGDIELGATQPSQVEMNANARRHTDVGTHRGSDPRLALQLRLDALNMLNFTRPAVAGSGANDWELLVPIATPGVRFLDDKLFLGLGLGFSGVTTTAANNDDTSRTGWTLSPTATYDLLSDQVAALSLVGWLNFARLSNTTNCANNGTCVTGNDHLFAWGASIGAGVRGFLSQGLSLGGEFGWGFLSGSGEGNVGVFFHGIFGNIFLEGSVGL